LRSNVRDQGVARGIANTFAHAIDETRGENPRGGSRERKERLGQRSQRVTKYNQCFSSPEVIAERAGENLSHSCGSFRYAFDDPNSHNRSAKHVDEKHRRKAVDELR
jgi:hypothetical protein